MVQITNPNAESFHQSFGITDERFMELRAASSDRVSKILGDAMIEGYKLKSPVKISRPELVEAAAQHAKTPEELAAVMDFLYEFVRQMLSDPMANAIAAVLAERETPAVNLAIAQA